MNHVLKANVSSTLEIFIHILILHLASFQVKNRNKMLNDNRVGTITLPIC